MIRVQRVNQHRFLALCGIVSLLFFSSAAAEQLALDRVIAAFSASLSVLLGDTEDQEREKTISTTSGSTGSAVVITGSRFPENSTVKFGNFSAHVRFISRDQIVAFVPFLQQLGVRVPLPAGDYPLVVNGEKLTNFRVVDLQPSPYPEGAVWVDAASRAAGSVAEIRKQIEKELPDLIAQSSNPQLRGLLEQLFSSLPQLQQLADNLPLLGGELSDEMLNLVESHLMLHLKPEALPSAKILLVDDDDNDPDVRSYYTDSLDLLGLEYHVYNTNNSDQEPSVETLSRYETVIWFTGQAHNQWTGAGQNGEAALIRYLESGGCVSISSQDYLFVRSITPLLSNYFGVNAHVEDAQFTRILGSDSFQGLFRSPFKSLGYIDLQYPFSNYSDTLTEQISLETESGFTVISDLGFSAFGPELNPYSGEPDSVGIAGIFSEGQSNTVTFKTNFLAFPIEAIQDLNDRAQLLQSLVNSCTFVTDPFYYPFSSSNAQNESTTHLLDENSEGSSSLNRLGSSLGSSPDVTCETPNIFLASDIDQQLCRRVVRVEDIENINAFVDPVCDVLAFFLAIPPAGAAAPAVAASCTALTLLSDSLNILHNPRLEVSVLGAESLNSFDEASYTASVKIQPILRTDAVGRSLAAGLFRSIPDSEKYLVEGVYEAFWSLFGNTWPKVEIGPPTFGQPSPGFFDWYIKPSQPDLVRIDTEGLVSVDQITSDVERNIEVVASLHKSLRTTSEFQQSLKECAASLVGCQQVMLAKPVNVQVQVTGPVDQVGSITSSPSGVVCGEHSTVEACSGFFDEGEDVTLTAISGTDEHFVGWAGGPCNGLKTSECVFQASSDATITAQYGHLVSVEVFTPPDTSASVISNPEGIGCNGSTGQNGCLSAFLPNTAMTLIAASGDAAFSKWRALTSGGTCDESTEASCTFMVNGDVNYVAEFIETQIEITPSADPYSILVEIKPAATLEVSLEIEGSDGFTFSDTQLIVGAYDFLPDRPPSCAGDYDRITAKNSKGEVIGTEILTFESDSPGADCADPNPLGLNENEIVWEIGGKQFSAYVESEWENERKTQVGYFPDGRFRFRGTVVGPAFETQEYLEISIAELLAKPGNYQLDSRDVVTEEELGNGAVRTGNWVEALSDVNTGNLLDFRWRDTVQWLDFHRLEPSAGEVSITEEVASIRREAASDPFATQERQIARIYVTGEFSFWVADYHSQLVTYGAFAPTEREVTGGFLLVYDCVLRDEYGNAGDCP
ncbi:MAG: IPT/TIG domain-containing protein [Chromatiaceae bacterium]|nr:IPT/TIG domain-containing protein [Chromatiaceae bacterium]